MNNINTIIYDKENNLPAITNSIKSPSAVILISGMNGDVLYPSYQITILKYCTSQEILCISPKLRSYPRYGLYTLDDDVEDLKKLIQYFHLKNIFLVGHSTGCQISMELLNNTYINIYAIVLQGPVSDREYAERFDNKLEEQLEIARKTDGILPFLHENDKILSKRFLDLFSKGGKDDKFSSDLPDEFFKSLNKKNTKIIILNSLDDEYTVNDNTEKLKLIPNSKIFNISTNHSCTSNDGEKIMMNILSEYLMDFKNNN